MFEVIQNISNWSLGVHSQKHKVNRKRNKLSQRNRHSEHLQNKQKPITRLEYIIKYIGIVRVEERRREL